MERRGFLGACIGTVAGLPFIAEAVKAEPRLPRNALDGIKRWVRAFELSNTKLKEFRCICVTTEGKFWAPKVGVTIARPAELTLRFAFATIHLDTRISVSGAHLIDDEGVLLETHKFDPIHMQAGDKLDLSLDKHLGDPPVKRGSPSAQKYHGIVP